MLPLGRILTSADTNNAGRTHEQDFHPYPSPDEQNFDDTFKKVGDTGCATAASQEKPGGVFT
jgi:hypothetical protein